jgi:hypothetical protein
MFDVIKFKSIKISPVMYEIISKIFVDRNEEDIEYLKRMYLSQEDQEKFKNINYKAFGE